MCGLALLAAIDGSLLPPEATQVVQQMVRTVRHRGPDGEEYAFHDRAVMGFARLSLVDPESGSQPLYTPDNSAVLIVNGEVYNHRELVAGLRSGTAMRTGSDCEVLLHLYAERGQHFLDGVHGMFAIILVDLRRNKLILARDRFGIKPLYFHRNGQRIVAASEIKALFAEPATPREVDWAAALASPLLAASAAIPPEPVTTWFRGIQAVAPGTIVEIDLDGGATSTHTYWAFPGEGPASPLSADELIAEYRRLLAESVRDCATADTELGLFLSGGIDSASVAALAREVTPVHTFTAVNAGTYANGDAEYAHKLSRHLGLPNHQVLFDPARVPGADEWKRLLWQLETPLCGPEQYYKYELYRYAKHERPQLRGMLLGAASDEFNGGYSAELSDSAGWDGFRAALDFMRRCGALQDRPHLAPWLEHGEIPLLSEAALGLDCTGAYEAYLQNEYHQIEQYNVWHEDRTAAASGIEARVPFLDHRLVELAAAVPSELRPSLLWDKQILRRAVRGLLPEEFVHRPKVAFFYGPGQPQVYRTFVNLISQHRAALLEEALAQPQMSTLVQPMAAHDLLRRLQDNPGGGTTELLLRLINLGLLEAMTTDVPAARIDTVQCEIPGRLAIDGWEAAETSLKQTFSGPVRTLWDVPVRLADGIMILDASADPAVSFVTVEGTIEYVVESGSPPGWRDLLRAVDGTKTLSELVGKIGAEIGDIEEPLRDAVNLGILAFEAPSSLQAQTTIAGARSSAVADTPAGERDG